MLSPKTRDCPQYKHNGSMLLRIFDFSVSHILKPQGSGFSHQEVLTCCLLISNHVIGRMILVECSPLCSEKR